MAMDELSERCMALDKYAGIERDFEHPHEFCYPCGFVFATTVGKQDKGNAMVLEEPQGVLRARDSFGAPEKHPIDTNGKSEGFS